MTKFGLLDLIFALSLVGNFILLKSANATTRIRCPRNLKGERGPPGRKGEPGLPGIDGLPGYAGMKGDSCPWRPPSSDTHVVKGSKGSQGFPGMPGFPGIKGDPGYPGQRGLPGKKGERGLTGRHGSDGRDGVCICPQPDNPTSVLRNGSIPRKNVVFYGHANVTRSNAYGQLVYFDTIVTNEGGLFNVNATENQTELVIPASGVYAFHLTSNSFTTEVVAAVLFLNSTVIMQSREGKNVSGAFPVSTSNVFIRANAGEDLQVMINRDGGDAMPTDSKDTHVTFSAYLIG